LPEKMEEFSKLLEIIAKLRGVGGCPWDKEQTHSSLREYLLEETYEVLDALDRREAGKLCGELGDLMLQIVLHAQIASENKEFTIEDVLREINAKLVYRHPHVFGSAKVGDSAEVTFNWEALKKKERGANASLLVSVPRQMPALAYSQEIQRRVAQVGFDWENTNGVIEKLVEETRELREAESREQKEEEFGDVLFTLVNIARRMGIDSESALRAANEKFYRRFAAMEEICRGRGMNLGDLSFEEQNALWGEAKRKLKS
jgi:tetrapyrrole methylase family protein / MazG family protein